MSNFEKIEAYTEGRMSAAERAAFEQELQSDSELNQDYQDWLEADRILKKNLTATEGISQLRKTLHPLTKEYFKEESKQNGKVILFRKYFIAVTAVAACLIIYFSLPAGIGDYSIPQMPQAVVRGDSDLSDRGAQLFNGGKYREALPLLKERAISKPEDATSQFFYAVSLIKTKSYEEALPVLDKLTKGVSAYKEDAAFFAALSAYELKKEAVAINYARQVGGSSEYYEQARKIIDKLD